MMCLAALPLQTRSRMTSAMKTFLQETLSSRVSIECLGLVLVVIKMMLHKLKWGQITRLRTFSI